MADNDCRSGFTCCNLSCAQELSRADLLVWQHESLPDTLPFGAAKSLLNEQMQLGAALQDAKLS